MKGTELIDSIRDEMAASKDAYITQMGEMMTAYLMRHPETEVAEGKTLKGAFSRLEKVAEKKKSGRCYAMPTAEALGLMLKAFGLPEPAPDEWMQCLMAMDGKTQAPAPAAPAKPAPGGLLDVDDLLGGLM